MAALKVPLTPAYTAAILLAAGSAARFGGDKLGAAMGGESVLAQSARTLAEAGCYAQTAIVSKTTFARDQLLNGLDFDVIVNQQADHGVSTSIRHGVAWAEAQGAEAVLIALADMPFVTRAHYARLFERAAKDNHGVIFSKSGEHRSPPAIFSKRYFSRLLALKGDVGARRFLKTAPIGDGVEAPNSMLADIDRPGDLARGEF
jgi:molybdenum cofactor cytidylyltransferase